MIAKKTTLIVLQNLLGMLFGFITLKLVTVNLGMDEYGEMASGFAVVSLLSFIANLGFAGSHVKKISEGQDLGTCVGTFLAIRVITTAVMAISVLGSLKVYTYFYPEALTDISEGVILSVLVYYIFMFLANIPTLTFDGRAETSKSQLSLMAQHPVKIVAIIYVVMTATELAKHGHDTNVTFGITWAYYTIGGIVTFLMSWGLFFYYKYPIGKPTWAMMKTYTNFAALTSISALLSVILLNADRVMLTHYWGIISVGQYFGVQSLMNIFMVISSSITAILLPVLSNLDVKKDNRSICRLLALSERHISLLIAPITFFVFFFSRPVITLLLSNDGLPAAFTLSFLAIVTFITALNGIRNTVLWAIGRPGLTASISLVIVVVNISLDLLLIPGWSWFRPELVIPSYIAPSGQTHVIPLSNHAGAAVALIFSNLVGFLLLRYVSWKCIRASVYHGVTIKHVVASIIMILPLIYLNRIYELVRWYDFLLYMFIGLGIYLAVLYLLKEFTKKDLDFYLGLINPKGLGEYISKELKEKDLGVAMDTMTSEEHKVIGKKGSPKPPKGGRAPRRRYEEE